MGNACATSQASSIHEANPPMLPLKSLKETLDKLDMENDPDLHEKVKKWNEKYVQWNK